MSTPTTAISDPVLYVNPILILISMEHRFTKFCRTNNCIRIRPILQ